MTDAPATERQAGDEIEVTPEMIEAGLDAWAEHDCRFEGRDDALRRVFAAMLIARKAAGRAAG